MKRWWNCKKLTYIKDPKIEQPYCSQFSQYRYAELCLMVAKLSTSTSGAMWLLNLVQITEPISGSVVPLAMF